MKPKRAEAPQLDIVPLVDPDFVRCDQNLMRIGFFSAGVPKRGQSPPKIRTFQLTVKRDGRRMDAVMTFEGSRGLPTIADCDKYMALMRIAADQKKRQGTLKNPITFTGNRFLREAGLTDAGNNYEDLTSWGQRMANTTINSKQVVFLANSRKYADRSLNVFQSFARAGKQDATGRAEEYEVVLTDWLLDNLNGNYVYVEEYGPYKLLTRPVAKALYGLLHWWFDASEGRPIEKDYLAVCEILGIKGFDQLSRIKHSIGNALDELVSIRYLARWEIQRRLSDDTRFKIGLWPGEAILKNLTTINPYLPNKSKPTALLEHSTGESMEAEDQNQLTAEAVNALNQLKQFGIFPGEAKKLLEKNKPAEILDVIEYVSYKASEPGSTIRSPQSVLVAYLRAGFTIPSDFVTERRRNLANASKEWEEQKRQHVFALQFEYEQWFKGQGEQELTKRYRGSGLDQKIQEAVDKLTKSDNLFARIPRANRAEAARAALVTEICGELMLPSFEEWCKENAQRELFSHN
jgi:hypothetical protein